MVGCPHGAKNTLVKNYLYLAEQRGAQVQPERTVIDIRPLGAGDGSEGYEVESVRSGAWVRRDRRCSARAAWSSSAGPLGTNKLLQRCRLGGSLPRISPRLGELVRTNSEAILAVTVPEDYPENLIKRVAITSSIYPDPHTHIETVTYGDDGDSMSRSEHAADRRRDACDAAAEAAGPDRAPPEALRCSWSTQELVAADDHHPRDADTRQRDRAASQTGTFRNAVAEHRTGSRAPNPHVHPGRQQGGRMVRRAHRRDRPELVHRGGCSTSPPPPTSSAAR